VPLTRDHIVPRSAGGPTFGWNTALACRPCNQLKDDHVMIALDLLWANFSRGRARGLKIVYPPNAIVRYIAKQLWAMRQGKPFRSFGRGRHMP
jgi:5-methylcytosine-specific restriction endonuclease McrA